MKILLFIALGAVFGAMGSSMLVAPTRSHSLLAVSFLVAAVGYAAGNIIAALGRRKS